jgi:hypothetical protein
MDLRTTQEKAEDLANYSTSIGMIKDELDCAMINFAADNVEQAANHLGSAKEMVNEVGLWTVNLLREIDPETFMKNLRVHLDAMTERLVEAGATIDPTIVIEDPDTSNRLGDHTQS